MRGLGHLAFFGKLAKYDSTSQRNFWLVLQFVIIGLFFSAIIPPFQSPDEFAHVRRAYLLGKGVIVLDTQNGQGTGGLVDTGLSAYSSVFEALPGKVDKKISREEIDSVKEIRWTGIREFSSAGGAGFYFPLIYAPQAIGLLVGEKFGFTVDNSYQLARIISILAIAAVLLVAFNIYPVNPLVLALLLLPMSVFQLSSATIDGFSNALTVLSAAAFLRIATEREKVPNWVFYTLGLTTILLATSRVHLLPLLLLLLTSCFYVKKKEIAFVFFLALLSVLVWLGVAVNTGGATRTDIPTSSVAISYLIHPLRFIRILLATLSNEGIVMYYRNSFIGVLGWLDTSFSGWVYKFYSVCLALIGIFSVSIKSVGAELRPRAIILFSAVSSVFLIFFLLLVTWTPLQSAHIEGIQGRYFLGPMIMATYAVSAGTRIHSGVFRNLALWILILMGGVTIYQTSKLIVERYYLAIEKVDLPLTVTKPSVPLDAENPIRLFWTEKQGNDPRPIKRMAIQFGTYARKNSGAAALRLHTSNGEKIDVPFELPQLRDNEYKYFDVDPKPYVSGEIVYLTGGGISTWEISDKEGRVQTCLMIEHSNGLTHYTRGCTRP